MTEYMEQRCPGCDSRKGGPCLCPDCRELANQGRMDEHGRPLIPGRVDLRNGKEVHVSWPEKPWSIAFGLMGVIDRAQKYRVLRDVVLPNGRFKVVLELVS